MATSAFRRLVVHASHYGLSSLFAMVAGVITFPILTRTLSVADYGIMNLIGATLTISVAIGKVGVQHSILRYHSETVSGKGRYTLPQLYTTTLLGMTVTGVVVAVGLSVGAHLAPDSWLEGGAARPLFLFASILVVVQVIESALTNFIRADHQTAALMTYQVSKKYTGLVLILIAILVVSPTLKAFYTASATGETLALCGLIWFVFRRGTRPLPRRSQFSKPLYLELLGFGIPMMIGYEIAGIILSVGDRYVIHGLIGETQVGLYSAAYNLCQYVESVFIVSVGQAIMPMYMRMWDEKGPDEASAFITQSLRNYTVLGAAVIAGVASVGPQLLTSLASEKYRGASSVLSWVIAGMVVSGANAMLGAGLFIHRRTRAIMAIVLSGAALNVALNLLLVPRVGIIGSAIATLVSYAATAIAMATVGRRLLRVHLPWATIVRAGLAALLMFTVLRYISLGNKWLNVATRVGAGGLIYGGVMAAIDRDVRALLRRGLGRVRKMLDRSSRP